MYIALKVGYALISGPSYLCHGKYKEWHQTISVTGHGGGEEVVQLKSEFSSVQRVVIAMGN